MPGRAAALPGSSVFGFGSAKPKEALTYMQPPLVVKAGRSYYQVKVSTADLGSGSQVRRGRSAWGSSLSCCQLGSQAGPTRASPLLAQPIPVEQLFILDTGNTGVQLPKKVSYPFTRQLATTLPDDVNVDTAGWVGGRFACPA